ncbi:D-tagatose-bisphosphate aldolase, class II, non-catalytic subunit [Gluconobacter oxydans]|uniref:D-tagatose-bisphosphate aldolase, class II, non-catalytic subunit n=1 Tax=Gluconobacter thailandicus TaxID=257438 RepID=A0AAP9JH73_GLUTH|nr:D-tagatose-bisphosphate aldolase, class II, non-catalytic subunit [Gluconobacter thailandicus]AFW00416.1 putative tagatose 6-phosphate kinase agaz [Gluconobacter oxydans H24]ANQ40837.1 D-tagatose-bisphosphate aldolase, class II, non-catalytic subunit [Gluconobacter oxydans]QEH96032.1 D-tagatose-bisphosphate aldolase, class II, non-catalytic subunit [Gluconobacter thailandicus]
MSISPFLNLVKQAHDPAVPAAQRKGLASVCSAHPLVLEAALQRAARTGRPVLIEATCNQVNQDGGYTGMTPADFRDLVLGIATKVGCPAHLVLLGGDHLGPNPWKSLPPQEAMDKALTMIEAFAKAGFVKLHLDASMGCAGEPVALSDETVAERACALAQRAESAAPGQAVYIIGTEVPVPGGAAEALDHLEPTSPEAATATLQVHETLFRRILGDDVWSRVIGLVVQPGVEFGVEDVVIYDRPRAQSLSGTLDRMPGQIFEAHSTDYQPLSALRALVEDGFLLLKVGPGLTFALREALYGLDSIRSVLLPEQESLRVAMERIMTQQPAQWRGHYEGTESKLAILRHYAYSDRIRYYWPQPDAEAAVETLLRQLEETGLPDPLLSQFLPVQYEKIREGLLPRHPRDIILSAIDTVLGLYDQACGAEVT